jgi:hypothetical protein
MTQKILQEILSDAIRFWERARLLFNAVLAVIVVLVFFLAWPASKASLSFDTMQTLFVLAVLANVAYCSAYVVDVFAQFSGLRSTWRRFRWLLFVLGLLFAAVITNVISSGLFPVPPIQSN